jgi:hypothetical protein
MILSQEGMTSLNAIKEKVLRRAVDFNKIEFAHLSVVYYEVTQLSRGKGLTLSKGCNGCIPSAVNIVYNYLQLTTPEEKVPEPITVQISEWNDLTKRELWEQIRERGLEAPATANKKTLIEILNGAAN